MKKNELLLYLKPKWLISVLDNDNGTRIKLVVKLMGTVKIDDDRHFVRVRVVQPPKLLKKKTS